MVKLNGKAVLEYKVHDADPEYTLLTERTWPVRGTFALHGHPPMPGKMSTVYFRNIRVKILSN